MKPVVDPDKMLPTVEKMIYKQAWRFSKQYCMTYDEAQSEAYWGFMKACYDYNPAKGSKFSSWCYYWIWCALKDAVIARSKDPHVAVDMVTEDEVQRRYVDKLLGEASTLSEEFREALEDMTVGLSDDARLILSMLLDVPAELLSGKRPTPLQLLHRVKKSLLAEDFDVCRFEWAQASLQRCFEKAFV